ncbi:hypothetical protein QR680_016879 [Steinernema hermaphroditum]|uniref:Uncharacterized protein n=1 Tax=Steinernema hermaphroditum TaxID=289476 RepID=A0AA39HD13_9BILA|nr:hypothetical protein QR680_016879 [Steinernema hermaphroditum]
MKNLNTCAFIFISFIGVLSIFAFVYLPEEGYLFRSPAISNTFTSIVLVSAFIAFIGVYLQNRLLMIPLSVVLTTWALAITFSLFLYISTEEDKSSDASVAFMLVLVLCSVITNVLIFSIYPKMRE